MADANDGSNSTRPGQPQDWRADRYARTARFVADLAVGVVDWLSPQAGEVILDLGCGDGVLSEKIARMGAQVIGVDSAPDMVAATRVRGIEARVLDGCMLDYNRAFDAVFSNAALHWMTDPDAVIAGVARALKPGGRFVGELGGSGNVAIVRDALYQVLAARGIDGAALDPWFFPTAEDYRARLEAHGFTVKRIELFERPTPIPTDLAGWLANFADSFLMVLEESARKTAIEEIAALAGPKLRAADGGWVLDYVRLRFAAVLNDPPGGGDER